MKIRVTLIQYDLLENEEKVIADGNAIYENNHLKYKEKDEDAFHIVTFEEGTVTLERKCDISSKTILHDGRYGHSVVTSPYGDMDFKTFTQQIVKNDEEMIVEYSLFSENNEILHNRLVWKLEYLS